MADRAAVFVADGAVSTDEELAGVYLFTHWHGEALPAMVAAAFAQSPPLVWRGPAYLARAIFEVMAAPGPADHGLGISATLCPVDHPLLVVGAHLAPDGEVRVVRPGTEHHPTNADALRFSFEEFSRLHPAAIAAWWDPDEQHGKWWWNEAIEELA